MVFPFGLDAFNDGWIVELAGRYYGRCAAIEDSSSAGAIGVNVQLSIDVIYSEFDGLISFLMSVFVCTVLILSGSFQGSGSDRSIGSRGAPEIESSSPEAVPGRSVLHCCPWVERFEPGVCLLVGAFPSRTRMQ